MPVCDQILTKVYSVVMYDFLRVYLNILYIKANVALLLSTQINTEFLSMIVNFFNPLDSDFFLVCVVECLLKRTIAATLQLNLL